MDDVKRKVYLDLFASPYSLIPIAGGLTSLMASWAVGGEPMLTMAGIAGLLSGAGVMASRLIWGLERLTERAYGYRLDQQRHQQELALDELDRRLTQDLDPRTQACLRELRLLYGSLQSACDKGKINATEYEILNGVGKVFDQSVRQLEHSHALWEMARKVRGATHTSLLAQRDTVVREVCDAVAEVGRTVNHFLMSQTQQTQSELNQVRRELNETIEAARRAEDRTAEWERAARRDQEG